MILEFGLNKPILIASRIFNFHKQGLEVSPTLSNGRPPKMKSKEEREKVVG